MSTRRQCTYEGCDQAKRAGHPKWCDEHWLMRQPVQTRVTAAQGRLELVAPAHRVSRVPKDHWPAGRRWCSGCQSFVLLEDTTGSRCSGCASRGAQDSRLKSTYVIHGRPFSAADYDRLFEVQGGRCYICRRRTVSRRFAIDHDHRTGEVRGLLCSDDEWGCNLKIIARFDADEDPVAMARRLVEYLSDPPAARVLTPA